MNNFFKNILQLTRKKIIFGKVKKKSLIVFDCESDRWLKELLINIDYFSLSTRFHKIKYIYINIDILIFIVLNIFRRRLKQNYLFSLIKQINPKIVITLIDNSHDFSIASKYFNNKIPFYAIQNANRGDIKIATKEENKKYYLDTFFCFGEYEKKIYERKSVKVKNFIFSGPIRASLTLNYIKNNKIKVVENEYDIALPAELTTLGSPYDLFTNYSESCLILAEYVHKLCLKHKLKLIFFSKYEDSKARNLEINFYNKKLIDYNYYLFPKESKYGGYINVLRGNLVIGLNSTILREAFYLKKKVFACNLTQHPEADFPIKNIASPKINNFNEFEAHTLKLLEMKTSKYFDILRDEVDKVVMWRVKSDEIILNSILKQINHTQDK